MPKASLKFAAHGRLINPVDGTPGADVTVQSGQIEYVTADVYQNGWIAGPLNQVIRSYSLIKEVASGKLIETTQPVIVGAIEAI
ncbi:MAG: hypothetical protein FGM32_08305 [Candidatus Kapabacteria bacterium]|nr:hypothetical protein [Candidatus Kapabacteria bacterium]